jgi:hypothetical protein
MADRNDISNEEAIRMGQDFEEHRRLARYAKREGRYDKGPKGRQADVDEIERSGPRGRMAEAGVRQPLTKPPEPKKEPPAQNVAQLVQNAVRAGLGKGVTREDVRDLVRQMLPTFLVNMQDMPPIGDPRRAVLGYEGGALVWRKMPGGGSAAGQACELDVTVVGTTFTVAPGELIHGTRRILYAGGTVDGSVVPAPDAAAVPPVEALYRWVFLELDLSVGSATAKILYSTPEVAENQLKPIDEPALGIYRIALSKWIRNAAGWSFVCFPAWQIEQHGIGGQ